MPNIKIPLPLKLIASAALLVFILQKVDLGALAGTVRSGNPLLILLALGVSFAAWYINTYKWQVLLTAPGVRTSYWTLLRLNFIGLFYNLLLPGQVGGEVVKSVQLVRMGVGAGAVAVSVVADRVTGLLAVLLLGGVGMALSPRLEATQDAVLPWMVGLAFILGAATVILVTGRGWTLALRIAGSLRLPIDQLSQRFKHTGYASLPARNLSALGIPLVLSLLFQIVVVLANLLVCLAFNIPLSFVQLLWVVAVVSVLQALPISIAGIGVREGAYIYLLQLHGVAGTQALALSLTLFALQLSMALTGGWLQLRGLLRTQG